MTRPIRILTVVLPLFLAAGVPSPAVAWAVSTAPASPRVPSMLPASPPTSMLPTAAAVVAGRASTAVVPGATAAASVAAGAPVTPAGGYRWPIGGAASIVRPFDPPPAPWTAGHRGVDLAGQPGVVVRSAGAGVIFFVGRIAGRGVVSVAHRGGLRTTYEPVEPSVSVGQVVAAGDPIGVLAAGHPGCPGACLHWGLRRGEQYLDPLSLLGLGRLRLLPAQARPASSAGRRRASRSYSSARL